MNSKYLFLFVIFTGARLWAGVPAGEASLQGDIDAASPGDTVWVAPGDHARGVTVDKAITLLPQGPGDSRLIGLTGSLATVDGLIFDGSLGPGLPTLVTAGSGLELKNCTFQNGLRGGLVQTGAQDVIFTSCSFNGLIEGILLEPGAVSMVLQHSVMTNCFLGLTGPDSLTCTGGVRTPADRCRTGTCGTVMILNSTFTGGDIQVALGENYLFFARDSDFLEAATIGITAKGVRLEMENCVVSSTSGTTGLDLYSVSGFVRSSQVLSWKNGIDIRDGGCPRYSDVVIGGALLMACDIGNQNLNLRVNQPEPVSAELNFWGTPICTGVLEKISGQTVDTITNSTHQILIDCTGTPVEPITWGRIRTLYGGKSSANRQ